MNSNSKSCIPDLVWDDKLLKSQTPHPLIQRRQKTTAKQLPNRGVIRQVFGRYQQINSPRKSRIFHIANAQHGAFSAAHVKLQRTHQAAQV